MPNLKVPVINLNPPGTGITSAAAPLLTGVILVALIASLGTALINAIAGNASALHIPQADLVWIAGACTIALVLARSLIAAFQNAGIAQNVGFITKVTAGLATIVGALMTGLYEVSSAWSAIAGNVSSIGVSAGTTAKIGGFIALSVVVGQALQAAIQNWKAGQLPPVTPPAPTPAP